METEFTKTDRTAKRFKKGKDVKRAARAQKQAQRKLYNR